MGGIGEVVRVPEIGSEPSVAILIGVRTFGLPTLGATN